jgi:hypothetical protein
MTDDEAIGYGLTLVHSRHKPINRGLHTRVDPDRVRVLLAAELSRDYTAETVAKILGVDAGWVEKAALDRPGLIDLDDEMIACRRDWIMAKLSDFGVTCEHVGVILDVGKSTVNRRHQLRRGERPTLK